MPGFLPAEDWLEVAKRLPIGMPHRQRHGREIRHNLVIENTAEAYVAYCQACKLGGRIPKEHVRLTGLPPAASTLMTPPHDMVLLGALPPESRRVIHAFLVSKGVDPNMPTSLGVELWYSESRKRLILRRPGEFELGRDLTDKSMQKWISYTPSTAYLKHRPERGVRPEGAVVVEDPLSFIKVAYVANFDNVPMTVYSSLGTRLRPALVVELLKHPRVLSFYDGDAAGAKGGEYNTRQLRAYGVPAKHYCAPGGLDPKDMTHEQIVRHLEVIYEATL